MIGSNVRQKKKTVWNDLIRKLYETGSTDRTFAIVVVDTLREHTKTSKSIFA